MQYYKFPFFSNPHKIQKGDHIQEGREQPSSLRALW